MTRKKEVNMNIPSNRHLKIASRTAIVAAVLGLALPGLAETALPLARGKATVDFPFVAGSSQLPPGSYTFESDGTKVTFRSADPKGPTAMMLVVTRLGRHDRNKGPELVFDKVGGQMKLSQIWSSEQDGYLVLVSPEVRGHEVVGVANARK
jgi:hypothetical protein